MTGPIANNVVSIAKGAHLPVSKHSHNKQSSSRPQSGSSEAEVAVLYPHTKTSSALWSKAQKSISDGSSPDSEKLDDAEDLTKVQDVFGSLVASVGQKLTEHQDQSVLQDQPVRRATNRNADISSGRGLTQASHLMRSGLFSDSTQNVEPKTSSEAKKPSGILSPDPHFLLNVPASQKTSDPNFGDRKNSSDIGLVKGIVSAKSSRVEMPARIELGESHAALAENEEPITQHSPVLELSANAARADKAPFGAPKDATPQRVAVQVATASEMTPINTVHGMDGKLLSPSAQIVENIRNAIPAAPVVPQTDGASPQVIKTLEIRLQPEGLGPVTVSLKSEQGKLKVQISTKLDTTRQELERNSTELVNGLRTVDPTFTDVDVNFSEQNQGAAPDTSGQAFGNSGDRRGTPENTASFGSNGGQDADQANASRQNPVYGKVRPGPKVAVGQLPSRRDRADGIYI